MMQAVIINQYGGLEVLKNLESPIPKPQAGQVLIEVQAASLNPFDLHIREGRLHELIPLNFPAILGSDFAGTVAGLGEGVSEFKLGDQVYGVASVLMLGGTGTLAEYTAAQSLKIGLKPKQINMQQAAALPLVGATAIEAIEEHLNLQAGQSILIQGGAGGVGSLAIQLAKLRGAYVATTVATEDLDYAKSLGADLVIDYKTQDFSQLIQNYDAVFATAKGSHNPSLKVLKHGGTLVSMVGPADAVQAEALGIRNIHQMTRFSTQQFQRLAELIDSGQLTQRIDKIFKLSDCQNAFDYYENQHPRGKVVITVK